MISLWLGTHRGFSLAYPMFFLWQGTLHHFPLICPMLPLCLGISSCFSNIYPVCLISSRNDICEQTYYRNLNWIIFCSSIGRKAGCFQKIEVQPPVAGILAAVIIRLNSTTVEISEGSSQQTIQSVLGDITVAENIYIDCGFILTIFFSSAFAR